MTITSWTMYWVLILDSIITFFGILLAGSIGTIVISCSVFLANAPAMTDAEQELTKQATICLRCAIISFLICLSALTFIPTTKQMATILIVPAVASSELVQKTIPEETKELYTLAKEFLTETIKQKTSKKKQTER